MVVGPELQSFHYLDESIVQVCKGIAKHAFLELNWEKTFWNLSSLFIPCTYHIPVLRVLDKFWK